MGGRPPGPSCNDRAVGRPSVRAALLAVITTAVVACGGSSGHATATGGARGGAGTGAARGAGAEPAAAGGRGWTTFGGAASRAGVAPGAPAAPKLRRRYARTVDGEVYAQPLLAGGRIYVATENDSVYAFTTDGKLVWRRHLGAPGP